MKKAFSVWPDCPGNAKLPEYLKESSKVRAELLKEGGFDFHHLSQCDQDDYAKRMVETYLEKPTIRKATSISDYTRIVEMIRLFEEEGCQEVLYLDYDFHMWELPTKFGIVLESHIQADENGLPYKLWYRGQNAVYYLSREHLPLLINHRENLRKCIVDSGYKPKYCFPMNYMGEFEEKIGYIPGYRHLGTVSQVNDLWEKTVMQMLHLSFFIGDMPDLSLTGVNLTGSANTTYGMISAEYQRFEELRETISSGGETYTEDEVRDLITGIKLRPNYNSLVKRKQLKDFVKGIKTQ